MPERCLTVRCYADIPLHDMAQSTLPERARLRPVALAALVGLMPAIAVADSSGRNGAHSRKRVAD